MRDLAYDLAENAAKTNYNTLSPNALEVTKKFILDTLGCAIAGSTAAGCPTVVKLVQKWGGSEESTIIMNGSKVIAPNAAMVNGMMCQALDLDDIHEEAVLHANTTVLPAALAVAERKGNISGQDLITAVAVGVDVDCRVGLGVVGPLVWMLTSLGGYFGSAVAAGKIMGMDASGLHNAMGIAFTECAGTMQAVADRALVKRMIAGFAAKGGVLAAILAQEGITGARNIFEGQFGFFTLFFNGKYDRNRMLKDLGQTFEGENLSVKLYIGGRYTHCCIDATLSLVKENNIKPENVKEVVAHVPENSFVLVGKPFAIGENPQVDAQFSIPYAIALAIARGHVFIDDFFEEKIRADKQVMELANKVKVVGDQGSIASVGRALTPCIIELKTRDNKVYSQRVAVTSGSPGKPASMADIAEKFRKCCAFSAKPMPKGKIEEIIRLVNNLEQVPDIANLVKLLA
ncbi:MAG: MmgE/PrpD family protein [Dehalococcoidales bacterium]|nr:MmgE/PrpD family protein [Dehalococcoidales bacterium]